MKKIALALLVSISFTTAYSQCEKIFDYQEGTSWHWANYDKKGKSLGKTIQKVDKYAIENGVVSVKIIMVSEDAKGKQAEPVDYELTCKDGVVYYDMKKFVPSEYLEEEDGELKISVSGTNLEMPSKMEVGDKLKDAAVTMNISGDSPVPINLKVDIYDRQVEAEETLNTPAGEFNCMVISQSIRTKVMMSIEMSTKEWYSEGVGMVKSESYRKGKLTGYSLLTMFSK
jgi:hypothetical protein